MSAQPHLLWLVSLHCFCPGVMLCLVVHGLQCQCQPRCYAPTPAKNITHFYTDDYMGEWAQPFWGNPGRQDLDVIRSLRLASVSFVESWKSQRVRACSNSTAFPCFGLGFSIDVRCRLRIDSKKSSGMWTLCGCTGTIPA